MRALALAGRFVFALSAAFFMEPRAFGIYGLIAASSYIFIQIAGIEAFAVVMRRIAVSHPGEGGDDRPFYGRFMILSACLSFIMGAGLGHWFGWSAEIILLSGGIVALEYIGVEAVRILAAEKRPDLSLYAASMRFTLWSFGFPLLGLAGLLAAPWKLEWVLLAWLVSDIAALAFLAPVWRRYGAPMSAGFWTWYRVLLRGAPRWVIIALAPRFLESGVRVVPGFAIDEAAAGRFVFLATLAAIGSIGLRSVIEPFFFARMLDPEEGAGARRQFARATAALVALGALASALGWGLATRSGGKELGEASGLILTLLVLAGAAVSFSQIAHYRLYAGQHDGAIFRISLITLLIGIPLVFALTFAAGMTGTALGAALTALLFLALKLWRSGLLGRGEDGQLRF
jgi:hypothetical protein